MKKSALLTTEESSSEIKNPVLIVDKDGTIGKELILQLGKDVQAVFATRSKPYLPEDYIRNVVYVPFTAKFPTIPDSSYSFIFVIEGMNNSIKNFTSSFIEKAEKDKIPLLFAFPLARSEENFLTSLSSRYSKIKILVYGEVFDKNFSLHHKALVNKFLFEAFAYEKLKVPGSGLGKTYPVYLNDLTAAMIEAVFGTHESQQIFFAFPKNPPTALAIARAIQRANPEVKIDFSSEKGDKTEIVPGNGLYLLPDKYALEEKIKEVVLSSSSSESKREDLENYIKQKANEEDVPRRFPILPILLFLLFLIVLPLVVTFSSLFFGIFGLSRAQASFNRGDINLAASWAARSRDFFSIARATYEPLYFEANTIGLGKKLSPLERNIEAGRDMSKAIVSFSNAYKKLSDILSGKSSNPSEDFSNANLELSDGLVAVRKLESSKDLPKPLVDKIKENSRLLNFVASAQAVLPQIIGVNEKRSYLVLFQNSMELRPTGGFIGSYGVLSLEKGKIRDFTVSDVYDADGQLKGHVEPPYPIRRYLPSEHWYLRDSNFDLDFSKAASVSAFFLETETGQKVDGVVAVNVFFVEKLLKLIGGVKVPEYNETVTSDNFVNLAQKHSQKNFFPGSTQKKDFLGAVFRAMQQNFEAKKGIANAALARVVEEAIVEKDVLLASSDASIQGLFTVNNWSFSLWDNRDSGEGVVNDFVAINEANLGVNKVNHFIERKVFKNTTVNADREISSQLSISYENKSDGSWPGGDYKNYLRIILPKDTNISKITIDGKEQDITDAITDSAIYERSGFRPPSSLEVEKVESDGNVVYGLLLNVPKKTKKNITFTYLLFQKLSSDIAPSYSLRLQKQPGIKSMPFELNFSYPPIYSVVSSSTNINKENDSLSFKKNVISDEEITVNLAKNK